MTSPNDIDNRFISAIEAFLLISEEQQSGPLDDFAIDIVCETLRELSVSEGAMSAQLKGELNVVKARHIPEPISACTLEAHSLSPLPSRDSSPTPSSSSSRESSPAPSRRASPPHSCTTSPTAVHQQPYADSLDVPQEETEVPIASPSTPPTLSSRVRVPPPLKTTEPGMFVSFFPFLSLNKSSFRSRPR